MGTVDKALEVLDIFLNAQQSMGVSEAAKLAEMNPATTYRLISSLVKGGYLEQLGKRGKYVISTKKLMAFSNVITPSLKIRNIALSFLHELSTRVQETTQVAVRLGNVAFKDDYQYSSNVLNVRPSRENIIDLYSTATGKILLAAMSDAEFEDYCQNIIIRPLTPNTITDIEKLKHHLSKIRREGISYDLEGHEIGIISVAAPVTDTERKVVAAVSVIAPSIRMTEERMKEVSKIVKEYAGKISKAIK